ncbi:MAG: sodium:solute symporter [Halieaceae bacterium]
MLGSLTQLDWTIICAYLAGIMGFAIWLSRGQNSREDYYVGARRVGPWPVALSIMATQCSTNSILGAPAFVAFAAGGGLVWLQYELALPLAMIFLILFVMPLFRHLKLVSIYEYLELRFDLRTRLVLSGLFLFIRAFATAVTVYSIALVIDLITGVGFFWSVMLLGTFTVVYDIFGGIRGVIYSDVIQLLILVMVLTLLLVLLTDSAGGFTALLNDFDPQRRQAIDLSHHGFGDGHTFAFWPMLIGGFFLYVSYYGCDQSQVQRSLSTEGIDQTNQALFLNGLLRFPLVALYCLVGVGIAVLAADSPDFLQLIPTNDGTPEYNLAVPVYMLMALPTGLVGLAMVALFAAAMSSLDSVINSLSATTMEDFVRRFSSRQRTDHEELMLSRWLTVFWGVVTLTMSFFVGDIAPTVLEAINKIGSLANGPILAVFMLGFFVKGVNGPLATFGLLLGIAVNGVLWVAAPAVSWLWWNPIGFAVAFLIPVVMSFVAEDMTKKDFPTMRVNFGSAGALANAGALNWRLRSVFLVLWCGLLCGALVML